MATVTVGVRVVGADGDLSDAPAERKASFVGSISRRIALIGRIDQ